MTAPGSATRSSRFAVVREHGSSIVVTAISSGFGVLLLSITGALAQSIRSAGIQSGTLEVILSFIAFAFLAIALYVGGIVTANTFSTIIAGRVRTIALLRLIGSSATAQRRSVAKEGLLVGVAGSLIGAVLAVPVAVGLISLAVARDILPDIAYSYVGPDVLAPIVAVALTTVAASWIGSRRVLSVSPMEATGAANETSLAEQSSRRGRNVTALVIFLLGDAVLVLGVVVGLVSPYGLFIAIIGGMVSFTGVVLGAGVVMPRALRAIGRLFGSGATARLAGENAVRHPERSARTTVGLMIAVTLITTFAVALESFVGIIRRGQENEPEIYAGTAEVLQVTVVVFSVLIGFAAVIAAIGMVNNLSLSVLQRTRELGMLRALGFTVGQVRRMILIESAQLTTASAAVGLALGTFYGWAGAQSLVGGLTGTPGIVAPAVPLPLLAVTAVGAAVLATAASIAPSRRATRTTPVSALATV